MITLLIFRFFESYFRHRWLYLLPIAILLITAGVFFSLSKPKFIARGSIYVQTESFLSALNSVTTNDASWWATPAQAVTSDINELLATDAFIRAVIHETNLEENMNQGSGAVSETIDEVRKSIWIVPLGENQIQINAANEDAQVSYQITNAVLSNFVQWQVNAQRTEGEAAQAFFADLIKVYGVELETARENLRTYLTENPPPLRGDRTEIEQLEIERLQGEIQIASSRYLGALEKEENARLALAQIEGDTRQSYTIIDAPTLPEKPAVSRRELALQSAIFLAVGLVLSIAAVTGSMILDRSFRFPFDVQYGIHLPVLAMVPDIAEKTPVKHKKKPAEQEKTTEPDPESAENKPQISEEKPTGLLARTGVKLPGSKAKRKANFTSPPANDLSKPEVDETTLRVQEEVNLDNAKVNSDITV